MEIIVETLSLRRFIWKLYIPRLDRSICEASMIFPRYDSCVKDAIRFRKAIGSSLGEISISYQTPKGKAKTI